MLISKEWHDSLERIQNDNRLGPSHISLFIAILQYADKTEMKNPVSVYRKQLMPMAKILARGTFDKNMKELHNYGYIKYIPSFSPYLSSLIYIADECENIKNYEGDRLWIMDRKMNQRK